MGRKWDTNIKILSHVHDLINMENKDSKLIQNIKNILEKEGLVGYEVKETENKNAEVIMSAGEKILIRGKDTIDVREKKLKKFISLIISHDFDKTIVNSSYGNSINPISSQEENINLVTVGRDMGNLVVKAVIKPLNSFTSIGVDKFNIPEVPGDEEVPEDKEVHVKEGNIEFDLLISVKNGKKYYSCPCNKIYNQKGHAKWNHIKRHLNRKRVKEVE